ncbi:MAG: hypothetical protein U0414_22085 [Polyangiaceae bacterium]
MRSRTFVLLPIALVVLAIASCSDAKTRAGAAGSGKTRDKTTDQADPKCHPSADVVTRFKACREATSDPQCRSLGGAWQKVPWGISGGQRDACVCEIPDAGCPCTKVSDCIDECLLEGDWKDCKPGPGKCGAGHDGCYCFLDKGDKPAGICVN